MNMLIFKGFSVRNLCSNLQFSVFSFKLATYPYKARGADRLQRKAEIKPFEPDSG